MGIRNWIVALGLIASTPSLADELYRLNVDLDGDGKPEVVEVFTGPASEDWRSTATVKIGSSTYSAEYFSEWGDIPHIRVVSLSPNQQQLILETLEPASCIYHVLTWKNETVLPMMVFDSGPHCKHPEPYGEGRLSTLTWQGFWEKEDKYLLDSSGSQLILQPQDSYQVTILGAHRASGAAAKRFNLAGADCPSREVLPGTHIVFDVYSPGRKSYRLETLDGGCGWISEDDVFQTIHGLPIGN